MSHARERDEKICLNCNTPLYGRYCHRCGQENVEPRTSVWGLITHFFYDITHFDGKFFSTTKYLLVRPGFLPKEYMLGRRASYLNPIRMYIFTSAFFFLIFFSVYSADEFVFTENKSNKADNRGSSRKNKDRNDTASLAAVPVPVDSPGVYRYPGPDTTQQITQYRRDTLQTTRRAAGRQEDLDFIATEGETFTVISCRYTTKEEYDSVQNSLLASERDGWLTRKITLRKIEVNSKYRHNQKQFWADAMGGFLHSFPYLLFVSLPLYALYLKLLYIRRKKYYYVDHGMFLIYLYIFTFLFLLVLLGISEIRQQLGWNWLSILEAIMMIWGIYYAWRAMYKFYEQGRLKTLVKFMLFNFMCGVSIIILFVAFFLLTIFRL